MSRVLGGGRGGNTAVQREEVPSLLYPRCPALPVSRGRELQSRAGLTSCPSVPYGPASQREMQTQVKVTPDTQGRSRPETRWQRTFPRAAEKVHPRQPEAELPAGFQPGVCLRDTGSPQESHACAHTHARPRSTGARRAVSAS